MLLTSSKNRFGRPGKLFLAVLLLLFTAALPAAIPAGASSNEHKRVTFAEKKSAVPLKRVIRKIRKNYGGRLLKIELEKEEMGGRFVLIYEAKVLISDGRVLKLYYDAKSLKLLKRKGSYKKRRIPRIFSFWSNFTRNNHEGGNRGNSNPGGSGNGNGNNKNDNENNDDDDGHDNDGHDDNDDHDGKGDDDDDDDD